MINNNKIITQNKFLYDYDKKNNDWQKLKKQCVNLGQDLKTQIATSVESSQDHINIMAKLNEIGTQIQERINQTTLTLENINKYKAELRPIIPNFEEHEQNINDLFKCIIVIIAVSNHDKTDETKYNYFGITDNTEALQKLLKTNSRYEDENNIDINNLDALLLAVMPKLNGSEVIEALNNTDTTTQQRIALAIRDSINTDTEALKALTTSLATMNITDPMAQIYIAEAIANSKFGTDTETLRALATSLATMNTIDTTAQLYIAGSIRDGKFGTDTEVLKALATSLATMNITETTAQRLIAWAIQYDNFGTHTKVLKALATSLATMNITDTTAQQHIALAIYEGKFGTDTEVLKALVTSLATMNITDTTAQQHITLAIYDDKFGTNTEVLKALVTSLDAMNITDPDAQFCIVIAIRYGKFGTDTEILKALVTNLDTMHITYKMTQQLAVAIYEGKFGTDPEVLKTLATILGKINSIDTLSQQYIASAIRYDQFGSNPEALKALVTSLATMNITDPDAQFCIAEAIEDGKFSNDDNDVRNMYRFIFSRWLISNESKQRIFFGEGAISGSNENRNIAKVFFGEGAILGANENENIAEEVMNECNACIDYTNMYADGYGSFGIIYDITGAPELLITYNDQSEITDEAKKELLSSLLSMKKNTTTIYQQYLKHINVYDLTNKIDNYPIRLDLDNEANHTRFPSWLKHVIEFGKFKFDDYKYKEIIKFAFDLVDGLQNNTFKSIIKNSIQMLIRNNGDGFKLMNTEDADISIKDSINEALHDMDNNQIQSRQKIDLFWAELDLANKVRLIFLLGQIAKAGALGYHYAVNRSNEFYYSLTKYCVEKLYGENHIPVIRSLKRKLDSGECIESAVNNFALSYHNGEIIQDIWQIETLSQN